MARFDTLFKGYLEDLERQGLRRSAPPTRPLEGAWVERGGRRLLNFSSNDYLGLARHPELVARARAWAAEWGAGAGASRLVCGTLPIHEAVEARIARLKGTEAALVLASGFQTNAAVLPALLDRRLWGEEPVVFTDRLNHASLHHGCFAAGLRQVRFPHNDMARLRGLLEANARRSSARVIVTESVFSMDGDRADLAALAALAREFDALLYVDEAHATGVLGPGGAGLAEGRADVVMGTFSKALGGFGAYVACSARLREYLINRCGGFIYTTAPPPALLGAMDAALDLLPGLDAARAHVLRLAERLRAGLAGLGIDTCGSTTQIVPAVMGSEARTMAAAAALEEAGLLGIAIRPPTVPPGRGRLRLAVNALHGEEDIDRLLSALAAFLGAPRGEEARS